jgi:quinol monooxygenase YgiN
VVLVIARFRPKPETLDAFRALLREVQEASRADAGCLNYGYYAEVADPLSYVAVEEWEDMGALEAHLRQPHIARLIGALPELGDGPPEIVVNVVSETVPLPLP